MRRSTHRAPRCCSVLGILGVVCPSLAGDFWIWCARDSQPLRYPAGELQSAGLSIYTTLAPSARVCSAEQALGASAAMRSARSSRRLQGAMVVTGARDGEVQALIGARDPDRSRFPDRAIEAKRPIGSLMKPFVYLIALAQPQTYSAGDVARRFHRRSPCSQNGTHWTPQNDDHETHGRVPMIDALAHSACQSGDRAFLGIALGVR